MLMRLTICVCTSSLECGNPSGVAKGICNETDGICESLLPLVFTTAMHPIVVFLRSAIPYLLKTMAE